MTALYRYSRWDGTQQVEPFTASDLMDYLADRMLEERDLRSILRELLQRGADFDSGRRMPGLRDLLERLRNQRQQQLQRYNLSGVMNNIEERLDKIVQTEREGIEKRQQAGGEQPEDLQKMFERIANQHLQQLDQMPNGVGGKMQALREYDFLDQDAKKQFDELMEELRKQILDNYFQGIKQSLGAMTPEMMSQLQDMVRDLNDLLERHRRGDDSGFQDFMNKWGQFFPEGIENPEQLAEHMQRSMAQMQSLLDSMTPEMRNELNQMLEQLFRDGEFQRDLARLMDNLDRMFPDARGEPLPFSGDDPVDLQQAMRLMRDMNGLDELERELTEAVKTNNPDQVDLDEISRLLGEEGRRMAEEIKEFTKMLEDAGFIQRKGKDWALTPRAMRKVGERALEDIFGRIDAGLAGEHSLSRYGWGVERLDETKRYSFGDAFALDAQTSIMNTLRRQGPDMPMRMSEDDFEVYPTSSINQCSTVIMLDMSYSMLYGGRFQAGRKVALALDSLIRSKFPRDTLHVVAFSYFVLPLEPHQLLDSYWIDPRGTDFPEALRQARTILGRRKGGTKQIIMITDGEPHANSAGWNVGPWSMREAMEDTLREVQRCSRDGITVNTFMLDSEPVMSRFVKTLTKINQGRVFFADPTQLGEYVIVDYVKNRRRAA
ncbi:MAG TPA: VWA domain-containing protein [Chloroflexota bacterium]|nr:VWA domain-containing protein [Chloroflexota bacterium]